MFRIFLKVTEISQNQCSSEFSEHQSLESDCSVKKKLYFIWTLKLIMKSLLFFFYFSGEFNSIGPQIPKIFEETEEEDSGFE